MTDTHDRVETLTFAAIALGFALAAYGMSLASERETSEPHGDVTALTAPSPAAPRLPSHGDGREAP